MKKNNSYDTERSIDQLLNTPESKVKNRTIYINKRLKLLNDLENAKYRGDIKSIDTIQKALRDLEKEQITTQTEPKLEKNFEELMRNPDFKDSYDKMKRFEKSLVDAEALGNQPAIKRAKELIKFHGDKVKEMAGPILSSKTEKTAIPETKKEIQRQTAERLGTSRSRMMTPPPASPLASPLASRMASPYASDDEVSNIMFDENQPAYKGDPLLRRPSSPQTIRSESPILESFYALQAKAPEIQKERARAVSKLQTKESLSKGQIPTDWYRPTEPYPAPQIESPETRALRSELHELQRPVALSLQKPMRPLTDTSETHYAPPEERQYKHDVYGLARENYRRPHNPYPGEKVAGLSPGEVRMREMNQYMDPFTNREQLAHEAEIENRINYLDQLENPSSAAEPYLNRMSENPLKLQEKLFGESERQQLRDILAEEDENFYDNVLPQLKRKYMVPGLKRHGGMQRSIDEAVKKYQKQRGRLANEFRNANKKFSIGAAQNYAQQQGTGAGLAAQNAIHDVGEGLRKAQASQNATQEKNRNRRLAAGLQGEQGVVERNIHQANLNVAEARHNDAEDFPNKKLNQMVSVAANVPLAQSFQNSTINAANPHPYINSPNNLSALGAGLVGAGVKRFNGEEQPVGKAKGGSVKSRKKRADGGSIMGEAVQNAVIDREDPLKALHKLMNRQRLAEMQSKSVRRRLRIGGAVSPIQQGANQANEYLGEKNLRSHYEGLKTPPERSVVGSLINDFMTGAAAANEGIARPRALGLAARAYTKVADKNALERKNANDTKTKAYENIYKLDKDREKLDFALKKEKRDEKKLTLEERKINAEVAKLGRERTPGKLQKGDQDILASASKFSLVAPDIIKTIARLKELSARLKTGGFSAVKLGMDSPWTQAQLGNGTKADFEEFDALAKTLANYDMSIMQGTKGGAQLLRLLREQKVNGQMDPKAIMNILNTIEGKTVRSLEQADQIITNYQEGIAPGITVMNFRKQEQADDEAEKLKEAKKEADKKAKYEAKYPTAANAPAHNGTLESLTPHLETAPQDTVQEYSPSAGVPSEPIPLTAPMQSQPQPQMNPQRQKELDAKRQELAQIEEEEANLRAGGN